jgi:hypothetical protein
MAHVGLEAIEGQEDPALGLGATRETIRVGTMEGDECSVALEALGDGPRGHGDAPFAQGVREFWQTPVLGLAEGADVSQDLEPALVLRPGQATCGLGARGLSPLRAVRIATAPQLKRQT